MGVCRPRFPAGQDFPDVRPDARDAGAPQTEPEETGDSEEAMLAHVESSYGVKLKVNRVPSLNPDEAIRALALFALAHLRAQGTAIGGCHA